MYRFYKLKNVQRGGCYLEIAASSAHIVRYLSGFV